MGTTQILHEYESFRQHLKFTKSNFHLKKDKKKGIFRKATSIEENNPISLNYFHFAWGISRQAV